MGKVIDEHIIDTSIHTNINYIQLYGMYQLFSKKNTKMLFIRIN